MICIIRFDEGTENIKPSPSGWMIANNISDLIENAEIVGEMDIAEMLRGMGELWYGKHLLDAKKNIWLVATNR